jgi:hypothetical protein
MTTDPADDGEASDANLPQCKDCGAQAPQTNTSYTLIGQRHGWRLALQQEADGRRVAYWRCPKCWDLHRAATRP